MRLNYSIILLSLSLGLISCSSTKNINGTYRSNFADLGMFITKVVLKNNSSFEYRFSGDLIFDTATGRFTIEHRKLILIYGPRPIDTSGLSTMRSLGLKLDSPLILKSEASLPHVFFIRKNKLFNSYQDEHIIKRATKYNKTKKYLLFGSHYYKRKWYLKRVD